MATYQAQVISRQGKSYLVEDKEGTIHKCHVRSHAMEAVCGDQVECLAQPQSLDVIQLIQPRANQITRIDNFKREKTLAANINHLLIVIAAQPAYSTLTIDKYLACANQIECDASLIINKAELLSAANINIRELEEIYQPLTKNFIVASAKLGYGTMNIRNAIGNTTSILVGQSGVGKSSIINRLLDNTQIKVATLSSNIQQGKHTTTNAHAHNINLHGKIIDSPGVRTFMPTFKDIPSVMLGFSEFLPHLKNCKFNNCHHVDEPQCAIKACVEKQQIKPSRYSNYLAIYNEVKNSHL
jgi:ribosome biogenesis GTPase